MTHLDPEFLRRRFPRIYETCLRHGLDLTREPAPVTPAAHYAMGGVRTQLDGRTNLERLYAAGEAACTGVHGANRLASNSLLEGLVFGARAGGAMREWAGTPIMDGRPPGDIVFPGMSESELRHLMWEQCGILRDEPALLDACERMENVARGECPGAGRAQHELRNMHTVAGLIARCALARQESRGAHYRTDFPEKSHQFQRHSRTTNANHEISFN
jgi:L-aspartate oxidase